MNSASCNRQSSLWSGFLYRLSNGPVALIAHMGVFLLELVELGLAIFR